MCLALLGLLVFRNSGEEIERKIQREKWKGLNREIFSLAVVYLRTKFSGVFSFQKVIRKNVQTHEGHCHQYVCPVCSGATPQIDCPSYGMLIQFVERSLRREQWR